MCIRDRQQERFNKASKQLEKEYQDIDDKKEKKKDDKLEDRLNNMF